jgi:hypothetical protein
MAIRNGMWSWEYFMLSVPNKNALNGMKRLINRIGQLIERK